MKLAEIIERSLNLDFDVETTLRRMFNVLDAEKVTVIAENKVIDVVTAAQYENYFDVEKFVDSLLDAVEEAFDENVFEFTFVAEYKLNF